MKRLILATGLLSAFSLPSCTEQANHKTNPTPPNILFLFSDDQRADALGCAGNPYIQTPHIDALAESGVRFENAYIMGGHHGAICAPSRAMLLSGKSLFNVYDRLEGIETMPMRFGAHGYVTFGTGKWHNERTAFAAAFHYGTNIFMGGMNDHFNTACRDLGSDGQFSEPQVNGFSTDLFAESAIDFLNDYSSGSRENPFFCYVSFTAPHDSYSPREDCIDRYGSDALPIRLRNILGMWRPSDH